LLESDKQVVGPVSTQAPLDWRLGECQFCGEEDVLD
jgi:hypothetical protein